MTDQDEMTMKKQLTLSYTDSKKQTTTIHHFVSADGELFFEVNRELTLEELENWEAPKNLMGFHKKWFSLDAINTPFREMK